LTPPKKVEPIEEGDCFSLFLMGSTFFSGVNLHIVGMPEPLMKMIFFGHKHDFVNFVCLSIN